MNDRNIISRTLLFTLALLPLSCLAVSKCIDEKGQVSYQDDPCPVTQTASTVAVDNGSAGAGSDRTAAAEVGSVLVTVPGVGEVGVMSFRHWSAQVSEEGVAPTLKLRADGMSIQLTFIPHVEAGLIGEEAQKTAVREMSQRYVGNSVEQAIFLRRLRTTIGNAILVNFNEQQYHDNPAPRGQYSSITVGEIDHELMSVAVTILTNGPESRQHDDALMVLDSIVLVSIAK